MKRIAIICILTLTTFTAMGEEQQLGGAYGNVELGGGYYAGKPAGDEVSKKTDRIDNLKGDANTETDLFPHARLTLGYVSKKFKTDISGSFSKEGYEFKLGKVTDMLGTMEFTASYLKDKAWKNPYAGAVTGGGIQYKRNKTDQEITTYALDLYGIMESPLYVGIKYGETNILGDDNVHHQLKRDGYFTGIQTGVMLPVSDRQFLFPFLSLTKHETAGRLVSFNDYQSNRRSSSGAVYGLNLIHQYQWQQLEVETFLELLLSQADKPHPIFSKTRKDQAFSIYTTLKYHMPFGLKYTYLFVSGGYSLRNSNINFFDSNGVYGILGTGVNF